MVHSKTPRVRSSSSEMPFASLCPTQVSVAALESSKPGMKGMTGHGHTRKGMGMASLPSTIDRSQGVGKLTWESKNSDVVTYHVHLPWCPKNILSVNCMLLWSWANNFLCLQHLNLNHKKLKRSVAKTRQPVGIRVVASLLWSPQDHIPCASALNSAFHELFK